MAVKKWLIGSGLLCVGIVFIVMGAVTPIIVDSSLKSQARDKSEMKSSNHFSYWGEIPGKLNQVVFVTFNFFSIQNPSQVLWEGATPILTEKNGYVYQEFDTLVDPDSHGDYLSFFNYKRLIKTKNCIWSNFTSPDDQITTLNMGSWIIWDELKHMPRSKMALYSLYQLYFNYIYDLSMYIYSVSIYEDFPSFSTAYSLLFEPAGIDYNQSLSIYNDEYYGFSNILAFETWVEILNENVYAGKFVFDTNMTGSVYTFSNYFSLNSSQTEDLFSGALLQSYLKYMKLFYSAFKCSGVINEMNMCDPFYLGSLQWSSGAVLSNPVMGRWQPVDSIAQVWTYITGYPEMSFFLSNTSIGEKYPGVSFTQTDFDNLFNFNLTSNWPVYDPKSIMDVGRMKNLFDLAAANNFSGIQLSFQLASEDHARVLWDYLNSIVDFTALQGRYDPLVYDHFNRGISSELGLGLIGSSLLEDTLQPLYQLPITLTSVYGYLRLQYELNETCTNIVNETLPSAISICEVPELVWQNDTTGYQRWVEVYWYGLDSLYADNFMNLSGIDASDLAVLFEGNGTLVQYLSMFDYELASHYNCPNFISRCSEEFIVQSQWGSSAISMNFPEVLSLFYINNTESVFGIEAFNVNSLMPLEYNYYANLNNTSGLNISTTMLLLSDEGLYANQMFQLFFIYIFEKNSSAIEEIFGIDNADILANYLRFLINEYYFQGMITTKTVNELLFTNQDPNIERYATASPFLGGNPALSQDLVRFAKNETREQWEYLDDSFKSKINTGKSNSKKVRKLKNVLGQSHSVVLRQEYYGEGPEGPMLNVSAVNPWASNTSINGTDGWAFHSNIDKSSDLSYYFGPAAVSFDLTYLKTTTHNDLDCYRFDISDKIFTNVSENPYMSNFYQFCPKGLLNLTSVYQMPWFLSRPYFLNGDAVLNTLVSYTTPQYNIPKNYHSYVDIEKYSGTVFYQNQHLQYNAELVADAMFPLLGQNGMNVYGYHTYLPIYFTQRNSLLNSHSVNKHFDYIRTALAASNAVMMVGISLGCLFIIASGMLALKGYIQKSRERKSHVMSQVKQPILLA